MNMGDGMDSGKAGGASPLSVEEIRDRIWLAIASRRLSPGTRLKEEELAGVFNVSRGRIRLVLKELGREGLVILQANRGAFVAAPTAEDAADIFHLRRVAETRIIRRLAETISPEGVEELRALVQAEAEAVAAGDKSEIIRLSGAFHLRMAELLNSDFLACIMRELIARSSLVTAIYRPQHDVHCGPADHVKLLDALAARDSGRAVELMVEHIDLLESELDLRQSVRKSNDLNAIFP
ncbi:GntR family transcriptional regulator [Paracoccus alkanivorans]|uniref:GntR family transcriptional regulator n=2 Tax=Paracoccus alkanivorans TaxID=2116655 RepID=A0A3M0M8X9_9RHOB|nr:GntR family transcriptional regulator [Paracoccus alkanivorans]